MRKWRNEMQNSKRWFGRGCVACVNWEEGKRGECGWSSEYRERSHGRGLSYMGSPHGESPPKWQATITSTVTILKSNGLAVWMRAWRDKLMRKTYFVFRVPMLDADVAGLYCIQHLFFTWIIFVLFIGNLLKLIYKGHRARSTRDYWGWSSSGISVASHEKCFGNTNRWGIWN